jgi:hypothetical protein
VTRDEARAMCIEAMDRAFIRAAPYLDFSMVGRRRALTAAFDSLSKTGVHVVPTAATAEMMEAATNEAHGHDSNLQIALSRIPIVFAAMAAAGDLTDAPETKP